MKSTCIKSPFYYNGKRYLYNSVVIFLTYEQTVDYILSIPKFTKKNEPSHTRELLRRLGNPQEHFPVVHVAGSNGKGSVCAFLNSVMIHSKLHTGMFTSPHLVDIRERFQIDGVPCSKEGFLQAEQQVKIVVEQMQQEGLAHPTFFEYLFAVGMVLFEQEEVDCAILETGLGGRLDATNVVEHPLLTIITSISLEHTEILGGTIEAIAAEKAGIIKSGVPVIFDGSEPKAEPVILKAAREKNAPAEKISENIINILLNDGKNIDFSMESGYDVTRVRIPFPAEYQVLNGALALAAANRLKEKLPITEQGIVEGFCNAAWPGRMEEIYPKVYLDGAHNVSGIKAFLKAVNSMTDTASILLFSMVREKDYKEAIRLLCREGKWEEIVLTEISGNPRALKLEDLQSYFSEEISANEKYRNEIIENEAFPNETGNKMSSNEELDTEVSHSEIKQNIRLEAIKEPGEAFERAMADRKAGQKLFCAGSLYLVGEIKKAMKS